MEIGVYIDRIAANQWVRLIIDAGKRQLTPLGIIQSHTCTSSCENTRGVRFMPPIAMLRRQIS